MIYLGIMISENAEKIPDIYAHKLGDAVENRINNTKNPDSRSSRIGAYSLVAKMYEDLRERLGFSQEMPEIIYTGIGKPAFSDNNSLQKAPKFNISHDGAVSVCAFSLDGDVGVDVQSMPKRIINISRIRDRFFAPIRRFDSSAEGMFAAECEAELFFYSLSGEKILPAELSVKRISNSGFESDFLLKWTLLEAALKMGGGGFSDISAADALLEKSECAAFSLEWRGNTVYISVSCAITK